jgi:hypothetical protein
MIYNGWNPADVQASFAARARCRCTGSSCCATGMRGRLSELLQTQRRALHRLQCARAPGRGSDRPDLHVFRPTQSNAVSVPATGAALARRSHCDRKEFAGRGSCGTRTLFGPNALHWGSRGESLSEPWIVAAGSPGWTLTEMRFRGSIVRARLSGGSFGERRSGSAGWRGVDPGWLRCPGGTESNRDDQQSKRWRATHISKASE